MSGKPRHAVNEYVEKFQLSYEKGYSLAQIAKINGCSHSTVRRYLWPILVAVKNKKSLPETLLKRLHKKATLNDVTNCLEWNCGMSGPGVDSDKYGIIYALGKSWRAHRLAYLLHYGQLDENKLVCHKCDNRKCINPEHLFLGDHVDNSIDMSLKKRGGNQYLCAEEVLKIRELYHSKRMTPSQLCKLYSASLSNIWQIIRKTSFKHI